ncbi:MAG: hypothetical protein J6Y07_02630 [Alphaproteobacteria bacterium]|nr:hypothetical protein [Alphaproteobacteria bacterium]
MEPDEIALDFISNFEDRIKKTLGVQAFDKERAFECVREFVRNNQVILDYYDPVTVNPRVITTLIAIMYDELVPENVREERKRANYIANILKQKKAGHVSTIVWDSFLGTYFSGTVDTEDLKPGKNDFNSLALRRASTILDR